MHYRGLRKRPHLHPIRHCRLYRLPRPASYASRSCRPHRPQPLSARTLSRELPVRDTHQTPHRPRAGSLHCVRSPSLHRSPQRPRQQQTRRLAYSPKHHPQLAHRHQALRDDGNNVVGFPLSPASPVSMRGPPSHSSDCKHSILGAHPARKVLFGAEAWSAAGTPRDVCSAPQTGHPKRHDYPPTHTASTSNGRPNRLHFSPLLLCLRRAIALHRIADMHNKLGPDHRSRRDGTNPRSE